MPFVSIECDVYSLTFTFEITDSLWNCYTPDQRVQNGSCQVYLLNFQKVWNNCLTIQVIVYIFKNDKTLVFVVSIELVPESSTRNQN